MKNKIIYEYDTIQRALHYLSDELRFSTVTVEKHKRNWQSLYNFAESKQIKIDFDNYESIRRTISDYALSASNEFLDNPSLSYSLNILQEYARDGKILTTISTTNLSGEIGLKMREYISQKKSLHLKLSSLKTYELQLSRFLHFLKESLICDIADIDAATIFQYIKTLPIEHKSNTYIAISVVKRFLKWLFENNYISHNISIMIPSGQYTQQSKLPSVYSESEVENILESIDRGYATGKRNYLILLLATRLGLRSSDICNLRFCNINWDSNIIELDQVKTENHLTLPLLPEIGNTIIDYLKYGRPKSNLPYLLLNNSEPFSKLKSSSIYQITKSTIKSANIDVGKRRRGPHALRHSLAARMLEGQTAMPVISEVLGHANTSSTLYYLRIDITSLKACALDVNCMNDNFYEQFQW